MVTKIEMIKVEDIYNNPFNPRTDLGDISEMTESVKKDGIMQNLTVFPGHYEDEELKEGGYTLLIGHRRLACAKAAGLIEVPCGIEEIKPVSDQVSMMMVENGDRENLSIYDEARGIQLMLDFGETEDSIAEKTGFSKKTIKHRVNIAKLDQTLVKEKEDDSGFQMSLTDLYNLEKIEDMDVRNAILKKADSSKNLSWEIENYLNKEKMEKNWALLLDKLKEAGIEKAPVKDSYKLYSDRWIALAEYKLDKEFDEDVELPEDEETIYYYKWYNRVTIYKRAPKKTLTDEQKKQRETNKRIKQVKGVLDTMNSRRKDFVYSLINGKLKPLKAKETEQVEKLCWQSIFSIGADINKSALFNFITGKSYYCCSEEERTETYNKIDNMSIAYQMIVMLHLGMIKNISELADIKGCYRKTEGEKLLHAYDIFSKYGWSFEEGEKEILTGNSELYTPEVAE